MASMIDLDYDWESERRARIAYRRRQWFARYFRWFVMAFAFLAVIASVVIIVIDHLNHERNERAAYNEGRYGVDRATSLAMADAGIGKCAREILGEVR